MNLIPNVILSMKDSSQLHEYFFPNCPHFSLAELTRTDAGEKFLFRNFQQLLNDTHFYNLHLLASYLEHLRFVCGGSPLYLSCALRHPDTNSVVGGVSNSDHLKGLAADIRTRDMTQPFLNCVLRVLKKHRSVGLIRFYQYNPDKHYIHISLHDSSNY